MKQYISKFLFGILAAMVVMLPVQAQTYSKSIANSNGNFNVRVGVYNSGTTVQDGRVFDSSAGAYLIVSGTAVGQAIVVPVLADGSPGGAPSQTINVYITSPTVVSWTGPLPFTALRVSPSASLTGTNSVTSKIIQSK
ncbi:hypothetical protein ACSBOB_20095 [Mesorhizobium sp. ASY16-5R]|uniref:hypothetical protein n=1 Tax=Mesorhizobium sp. ASY16-5R TaxID=3445772 RepID=UPI003F9F74D0